jgi:acyl transferase domain-containing protein
MRSYAETTLSLSIKVSQRSGEDESAKKEEAATETNIDQDQVDDDERNHCSPLVFVFNGQGSQWRNMGSDLIATNTIFRSTMAKLQDETGIPLLDLYKDGSKWMSKEYSNIGIVSFQLALLAILREYGVRTPDFYLGHSVGEVTCSYLAGLASEVEVLRYAMVRMKLDSFIDPDWRLDVYEYEYHDEEQQVEETMQLGGFDYIINNDDSPSRQLFVKRVEKDTPLDPLAIKSFSMHGQMVVVGCSAEEVNDAIQELDLKQTRIACYNSRTSHTICGPSFEIDSIIECIQNKNKKRFVRKIDTANIAYHGIYMEVFYEWLKGEFEEVSVSSSISSCSSSSTSTVPMALSLKTPLPFSWKSTSRNDTFGAHYLADNIIRPVYFQDAIEQLPKGSTVVEIGPANILSSQMKRIREDLIHVALVERCTSTDCSSAGIDTCSSLEQSLQRLKDHCLVDNSTHVQQEIN